MNTEIYNVLKTKLQALTGQDGKPLLKTVMLWNNQFEHETQEENNNYPFEYPAAFIEFNNISANNLGGKASVQQVDYDAIIHIGCRILKNEDLTILAIKDAIYALIQTIEFSPGEPTTGRFTRTGETPNYDNSLLYIYEQTYHSTLKDFSAVPTPNMGPVTTLTTNTTIVTSL